ncbi:MAG: putative lipoprotein with Yx(FWY)xxD motif [Paracoccaceae bacterium]|jgi:predicted lipoprotein with Yx(FWY)xxD motif
MKKSITFALIAALGFAGTSLSAAEAWKTVSTKAGEVYADTKGLSLYTFRKDSAGKSKCNGACAGAWPPYVAADGAVTVGDWTLVKRKNGDMQWAYKGAPLYYWAGDRKSGDIRGEGVGGVWDLARPGVQAKLSKKKAAYTSDY